jgi:hypothetical protein
MERRVSKLRRLSMPIEFLLLFGSISAVWGQTAASPNLAQNTVQVLNQAISAMGGSAAWSQLADATVIGSCAAQVTQDGAEQTAEPFRWITEGNEFRYESGNAGQTHVLLSGHGAPSSATPNETHSLISESATLLKPFHLPGQVFATILNNPHYIVSIVQPRDVSDGSTIHIHVVHRLLSASESGSEQDWWLDASTYLPLRVTYRVPGQTIRSYMSETYSFSAWSAENLGLVIPHQITLSTSVGLPPQICTASEVQFNTQPAAALFDAR